MFNYLVVLMIAQLRKHSYSYLKHWAHHAKQESS